MGKYENEWKDIKMNGKDMERVKDIIYQSLTKTKDFHTKNLWKNKVFYIIQVKMKSCAKIIGWRSISKRSEFGFVVKVNVD